MSSARTIQDLLKSGSPNAPAIGAPGRDWLTFDGLRRHVDGVVERLNALGIGRNDRVAIVLPNGPEMASAFISVACAATTAPLNPAYGIKEFDFYLDDLKAKAIIVADGADGPAIDAADKFGIGIIDLKISESDPAGIFTLEPREGVTFAPAQQSGHASEEDIALILHTSGTTSRPKMVPLSHRNVTRSAYNIAESLSLTSDDRCMNIMPLFHIHGLVASVLSNLSAGGSVCCTPGFDAIRFFGWMKEADPTWYSAVPTMHQALVSRGQRNRDAIEQSRLRFIRSCSSALLPTVMADIEKCFNVPAIEAYGMTEAAHQMCANPLPPAARKPGTVGIATGPEVAIMDEAGNLLDPGETGEVVIRGENVFAGYEANEEANAEAFTNGWFRTGDQGVMDAEGYVTITGRLKEIIIRGGENISPREIDEVIMEFPGVHQVVTFAMPDPKLGEDIAAAVVPKDGASLSDREIQDFVKSRIAAYKVPKKVLVVDEIPKGATGKLQRIGLAEKLGLA